MWKQADLCRNHSSIHSLLNMPGQACAKVLSMQQKNKSPKCGHLELTEMLQIVANLDITNSRARTRETGLEVLMSMKHAAGTRQKSQGFASGTQTIAASVVLNRE